MNYGKAALLTEEDIMEICGRYSVHMLFARARGEESPEPRQLAAETLEEIRRKATFDIKN